MENLSMTPAGRMIAVTRAINTLVL